MNRPHRIIDRALLDRYHPKYCVACGRKGCDPSHIQSVGARGDDVDDNILALCHEHHMLQHARGWYYLVSRYPSVALALKIKGWKFDGRELVKA